MKVVDMNINIRKIMAMAVLMTAIMYIGELQAQAQSPGGADFCFFQSTEDDFMTVCSNGKAEVHILATNFDGDEDKINLITLDNDFVTMRVPNGDSRSTSQFIGTNKEFDACLKIDPLDNDEDVSPMVMYVSVSGPNATCNNTEF